MPSIDDRKKVRFGRYEILSELGRGAMGIVYKARDPKINRVVAVKTISLASQPEEEEKEYRERFFREAEAAGKLSHPGIVTVFDVGEEPETRAPYIVMEYVPGQSLDKLLLSREEHKIPTEEALQLALQLAEALDCAHGQGVVHRDIKPANILLTKEGHAKIADFGIARLNLANTTGSARIFGTPAFMSPEQLNGEEIDGRSDLFSLGVVLYTALTGYRPFQGNSAMTVAFKVVNRDPVPATVLDNELPPGLDYIISRAIAKDPSQRYQRGMEIVFDIQELRAGREPWSKAKEHNPGGPFQGADDKNTALRAISFAATLRSSDRKNNSQRSVAKLWEKIAAKYWLRAAIVTGFSFFAIQVGRLILHRHEPKTNPITAVTVAAPALPGGMAPTSSVEPNQSGKSTEAQNSTVSAAIQPVRPAAKKASRLPSSAAQTSSVPSAMLEIEVEHKFAQAHLSIWVDNRLAFTHELEGTDKRRLVVFHHVQGHEFHAVSVPAGKHSLRVQVTSDPAGQQVDMVDGQFSGGSEKLLRIQFDKNGKMNLQLQ